MTHTEIPAAAPGTNPDVTASRPAPTGVQPAGALTLPRVRNLLTVTRRPPVELAPGAATKAWLGLAGQIVDTIGCIRPAVTGPRLAAALEEALPDLAEHWYGHHLQRRGLRIGAGAAMTVLRHARPAGREYCGDWVSAQVAQLPAGTVAARVEQTAPEGARLAWRRPAGTDQGLLLDRLHHTHLGGLLMDEWMGPQVAADLQLGAQLAGDGFAGVRVIAHLAFASSLHVRPDGSRHTLGQCPDCTLELAGGDR